MAEASASPTTAIRFETPWAQASEEVLSSLQVSAHDGLSSTEAQRRLEEYGPNELATVESKKAWAIFVEQFQSLLVALLVAAMAAAFAFGEWVEGGAIAVVLVTNATIGLLTELKAVRSMEALRQLGAPQVTVRRDGHAQHINTSELVPGDIVLLEGGDAIGADMRIVEASKLQANESTLTGESVPVEKIQESVDAESPLAERTSMFFKGTVVTRGSGLAVVTATGMNSELGAISHLVEQAQEEVTPLEKRLQSLGRGLVWVTLVLCAFVAGSGYIAGQPLFLIIETAIALGVAAVPEGLPVIATISLARGMFRMARHNALVNRLSAVETLGATSIICTDKTGTLTENRMTVERVLPAGEDARALLRIGVLCNNAELSEEESDEQVGDPMEVALLVAGRKEGLDQQALLEESPELREIAFDSDTKMMATIHGIEASVSNSATLSEPRSPYFMAVKGAPESVIPSSTLTNKERAHWLEVADGLAREGLRVLAFAKRELQDPSEGSYQELVFAGLVALHDPPRKGVRKTIEACRRAGVRVVMVTGDHPVTAAHIARSTGLLQDGDDETAVLGREISDVDSMSADDRERLAKARVFARVSPKEKLDLIALHQSRNQIVAMTGDGVNDAPALRKADIGVAMGLRGTSAAREAAAMVLKDDNLSTLEVAIAEGRVIFENIRAFVVYLLSCNISEIFVVAGAAAVGLPLPLLPLQILFLNLVTDVLPALALGVNRPSDNVMHRPPRSASEPILRTHDWVEICGFGAVMTASVIVAFILALGDMSMDRVDAATVSFATLALAQLWHVFNMHQISSGLLRNEVTRNPWVWAAVIACVLLVLLAIYLAPLARVLSLSPPSLKGWSVILGLSLLPLLVSALGRRLVYLIRDQLRPGQRPGQ